MIDKRVDKGSFIKIVNEFNGSTLSLIDIITCYEKTSIYEPEVLTRPNKHIIDNSRNEDIQEVPYINLDNMLFKNNEISEEVQRSNPGNDTVKKSLDYIHDPRYKDVMLGKITYVDYMTENPGLKKRMQLRSLLIVLNGYRGFGVSLKEFEKRNNITLLLEYKQDSEKATNKIVNRYISDIDSFHKYMSKSIEILSDAEIYLRTFIQESFPQFKLTATMWSLLTILYFYAKEGYSRERVLYGMLRPASLYQDEYKRSLISSELDKFKRTSVFVSCTRLLERLNNLKRLISNEMLREDGEDKYKLKEIKDNICNVIDFLEIFNDEYFLEINGDKQCESLVCSNLRQRILYAKVRNNSWHIKQCWCIFKQDSYGMILDFCKEIDDLTGSCISSKWGNIVTGSVSEQDVIKIREIIDQLLNKIKYNF